LIVLVNVFDVHAPAAAFERAFGAVSERMQAQPGFRAHRLLRSDSAPATYVNVAEWDDERSLHDALAQPDVGAAVRSLMRLSTAVPHTYRTVLDVPALEA
jgi:long-chain acyl-CoA synthetase